MLGLRCNKDSIACGCVKVRSINMTLIKNLAEVIQYPGTENHVVAQNPETEDIEDHTANRGGRLDREVLIMPNVLALSLGPGLILDREDKTKGPGIVDESLIPTTMEGRNDRVGEVVDNLVVDLNPAHGRKGMTVDNTMDNTMTELNPRIHMMVLRVRVRRLHLIPMFRVVRNCGVWRNPIAIHATSSQPV